MTNDRLAKLLYEMSVLLEMEAAGIFRVRAFQRAAEVVAALGRPVAELSPEELLEVPGIGKSIAAHLREAAGRGTFAELEALRAKYPPGVLDLLKVQGLGPKRAKALFEKMGIDSLEKLKSAAMANKLRGLPGFGAKVEQNVLNALEFAELSGRRFLHWKAKGIMESLLRGLKRVPGVAQLSPAGSLRRGRETVGDLDILASAADPAAVVEAFTALPQVERVMGAGPTKAAVWLHDGLQCDLRVVPEGSFGAALQYFTGSKDHNVALRERANRQGLTVNEYGVFRLDDKEQAEALAGRTEEEVYAKLGLAWIPPELREGRGELEAAAKGKLPRLVEAADIRGDFHNHSNHTDGADTLEDMARAAERKGWEWVALGDHSQSLKIANGMSVERLRRSFAELEEVRRKVKGIRLMRSMEVDILPDGRLDYPDEVLDEIDVVIGSVHSEFGMEEARMTDRIVRAVRNPRLDILGHMTGRLLNRRDAYKVDAEKVLAAAAESGAAPELNGQPDRQDLDDVRARRAKELGCKVALDTDAHSAAQFGYMDQALLVARRAWIEKDDVINCMDYKDVRAWLAA